MLATRFRKLPLAIPTSSAVARKLPRSPQAVEQLLREPRFGLDSANILRFGPCFVDLGRTRPTTSGFVRQPWVDFSQIMSESDQFCSTFFEFRQRWVNLGQIGDSIERLWSNFVNRCWSSSANRPKLSPNRPILVESRPNLLQGRRRRNSCLIVCAQILRLLPRQSSWNGICAHMRNSGGSTKHHDCRIVLLLLFVCPILATSAETRPKLARILPSSCQTWPNLANADQITARMWPNSGAIFVNVGQALAPSSTNLGQFWPILRRIWA